MQSNNLTLFNFGESIVRTVIRNQEPWFIAIDVAKALGHKNPERAIRKFCKRSDQISHPSKGGLQKTKIIPESDVYRLTFRSNLPSAERFVDWLAEEVIPSIRKNGFYKIHNEKQTLIAENHNLKLQISDKERIIKEIDYQRKTKEFGKKSKTNGRRKTLAMFFWRQPYKINIEHAYLIHPELPGLSQEIEIVN